MLIEAKEQVLDIVATVSELYRRSPVFRACCQGIALLLGLVAVDAISQFPNSLRLAYVAPLWYATRLGGKGAGYLMAFCTTICLTAIDANVHPTRLGMTPNLLIQTGVAFSLMHVFYSVESKLRDATQRATRDPLTGLYNRFALELRAKKMLDRAILNDQPVVLAMIDCDRFKELNDTFGHSYGDVVLRHLARTLRRALPQDAIVARNGGDEFIAMLPNRSDSEAASLLDHALDRFMSLTDIVGKCGGFSYGLSVLREDGIDYEKLLVSADQDMYRRKSIRAKVVTF